jgi:signal transduction histidine kinase
MYSATGKPRVRTAAWRVSLGATLAFATGTMLVFIFLHSFVASDIQRRSDAWLSGEVEVLSDVAERTPKDTLYSRVVSEVAELASREVPNKLPSSQGGNDSVFFLQTTPQGALALWVGPGDGKQYAEGIRKLKIIEGQPSDLRVEGYKVPFRVASARMDNGSIIYLGLSERDQRRVLRVLRIHIIVLWLIVVLLGAGIVFYITRKMLGDVRRITEAASRIGESDLSQRVPTINRRDEAGHLAYTLNTMLDRIENSMHQLHTITDSLAHDLRSPLTAVRAKLERSLTTEATDESVDSIVAAIEELDRLTEFLTTSLDVAEAKADALRLNRKPIDLDDALRRVTDLYEPCMLEKDLRVELLGSGPVFVFCDPALLHRMLGNLFDNEMKHLPARCTITVRLGKQAQDALLVVEDDGPGYLPELDGHLFEPRVKGKGSSGHGLGLAFVEAVVRSHGGSIAASNKPEGGAHLAISLPLAETEPEFAGPSMAYAN